MADSNQQAEPARLRQDLEWETPSSPPKRSLFARAAAAASNGAASARLALQRDSTRPANGALASSSSALRSKFELPSQTSAAQTTRRSRLDGILPPHRTYFGRSRRFFLCAVVLPLLALVLGLGLGLGLNHHSASFLPLPGNGAAVYTGDLTYYDLGLGACGWTNTDSDLACAVSHSVFDAAQQGSNANDNPLCGRMIRVVRDETETGAGNVSVDVKVVDRCVGCEATDLDLSPTAFDTVADESEGRVTGSWSWLDE